MFLSSSYFRSGITYILRTHYCLHDSIEILQDLTVLYSAIDI